MTGRSVAAALLLSIFAAPAPLGATADPLPSWRDSASKRQIIAFVDRVTRAGSPDFVPPAARIATFDNDGTLWCEQPVYVQEQFAIDRVRELAPQHPEWRHQHPFQEVLDGRAQTLAKLDDGLFDLMTATHAGLTPEQFEQIVRKWLATTRHPRFGRPYTDLTYAPMVELLAYLRANGFKTYIVSGGSLDFMRPWTERAYGIPPEQVIGSSVAVKLEAPGGRPTLTREPRLDFVANRAGKAIGIWRDIGRRPVAAFGNSDGDEQMLAWTASGAGPRLAVLVHHTDSVREWAYDRKSPIGRLDQALDEAHAKGWVVVDMARDWKRVFAFDAAPPLAEPPAPPHPKSLNP
jgi:hypothetical protein